MGPNVAQMGPMGPKKQGPQMVPKWAPNHEPPTGPRDLLPLIPHFPRPFFWALSIFLAIHLNFWMPYSS